MNEKKFGKMEVVDWNIPLVKLALADEIEVDGDSHTIKVYAYKQMPWAYE